MLKCKIKKTTYFSAKAKFQKLGLFDFRDGVTRVVNLQTSLIQTSSTYSQQAKIIDSEISESEFGNSESESLKPLPRKASKSPQTLQMYLDFKRSLSEGERENFFNFVKEETKNLERKINDLEAWLASKNAAKQNRWEIYYRNYQEEKKYERSKATKQNQGSGNYSPSKMQRAIAEFQKRMGINQPVDEPESEETNSEKWKQQQAEINHLMDNSPEQGEGKSLAQQRREQIAEVKRQQAEIRRARKEAAEEWAKQQTQDVEQRKAEIQRQIEEFNQRQQSQNSEIKEENLEDE